jgi:predicted RNA-binding Zn ribbon-like protein
VDLSAYAELAVRLANTDARGEEQSIDNAATPGLSTLDGLRAFLADLGYPNTRVTRNDLDAIRALRTEFREIFAACAAGNGEQAIDRLNDLLIQHPVHPQISGHDGEPWHLHLTQSGCLPDRYAAGAAMGLAMLLPRIGTERLGICRAPSCAGVFIDTSPNRCRRYCGDRCAARANVTAFRARRHTGGAADLPSAAI